MPDHALLLHKEPPLAWLVFNRPERRNAVSLEMWQALPDLVAEAAEDPAVRVLLVRGGGEEAFISGADISQFGKVRSSSETMSVYNRATGAALHALEQLEKPLVAMIHGFCRGGGCSVALMCDLRLCADDASFGIPAARLGIAYAIETGVERLVQVAGAANAAEILMTARTYDAEEACHMGLVNRVIAKTELESFTRDYATTMADNAPLSVAAHKFFIRESAKAAALRDADKIRALSAACAESEDYREGVRAFMEKRRPRFQGS